MARGILDELGRITLRDLLEPRAEEHDHPRRRPALLGAARQQRAARLLILGEGEDQRHGRQRGKQTVHRGSPGRRFGRS